MPSPIDLVLSRLDGVKPTGRGKWMARTPTRKDKTPSLSIRELDDGRVLLKDFGGDDTPDVLAAIGLTFSDLYPDSVRRPARCRPNSTAVEVERRIVTYGTSLLEQGSKLPQSDLERLEVARRRLAQLEGRA
ncbi:virulence-associated protein E [Pseudomonas sp. MAP12]|uniref:Virulence-associated protein E n=1 Tax=Geopseudomonas aromaticivorans TaxID=2849492 RepID=A0ABS6MZ23_9GAMM|nr:virulence-associated protein E [Pseudomonas aromaticivorans]MBV2134067.1 virulence-associated protein E [Pseudomonas aromaticivorans]